MRSQLGRRVGQELRQLLTHDPADVVFGHRPSSFRVIPLHTGAVAIVAALNFSQGRSVPAMRTKESVYVPTFAIF
jgi:hypothetical protein